MTPSQIIVLATPVFLLLIAFEFAWGYAKGRNTYRLNDAINSISLGALSQLSAVFTRLLQIGIYSAIYAGVALYPNPEFWNTWYGWLLALLFYDLCYYWLHRMGHEVAVLWAAHVVHHQSQDYNLSTALRQPATYELLRWIFYVPMAVAGVPPLTFAVVALIDLLYQFWVHTEHVPRLGWFDRWFCSPSNHRVHHAVNDPYLDKNYGGILIIWDRLFGTFTEEREKCVYGTRGALNSWDPLWANVEVYWALLKDSWHTRLWRDKLRVWFKPPGWRPADVAQRFPKPAFEMAQVKRFHPLVSRAVLWFSGAQFALLLAGVSVFLWFADPLPLAQAAVWLAALMAALWALGAVLQGRINVLEVLLIESAALATASSAMGLPDLHHIFKPLTMVVAIVFVALSQRTTRAEGRLDALWMAALAASLAGDVLLMFPGYFLPGLVAFLLAHLCYLVLFKLGTAQLQSLGAGTGREVAGVRSVWFPSRRALYGTLGVGAAMLAYLWHGLGPVLRPAVAAYVVVIALMAAQAIGRATLLRNQAAVLVAVGAGFFMLSDALLAINRFAHPLPLASLWVLSSYYCAQILIATYACSARARG